MKIEDLYVCWAAMWCDVVNLITGADPDDNLRGGDHKIFCCPSPTNPPSPTYFPLSLHRLFLFSWWGIAPFPHLDPRLNYTIRCHNGVGGGALFGLRWKNWCDGTKSATGRIPVVFFVKFFWSNYFPPPSWISYFESLDSRQFKDLIRYLKSVTWKSSIIIRHRHSHFKSMQFCPLPYIVKFWFLWARS